MECDVFGNCIFTGPIAVWWNLWLPILAPMIGFGLGVFVLLKMREDGMEAVEGALLGVMGIALAITLPFLMMRLGVAISFTDQELLGYASIAGSLLALALGAYSVYQWHWSASRGLLPGGGAQRTAPGPPPPTAGAQAPMGAASIEVVSGTKSGQSFPISGGSLSIGRSDANDVALDSSVVSRNHAVIDSEGGQYYIDDMGSTHGTMVDGNPVVGRTPLAPGALIQLGDTQLRFSAAAPPMPANAPTQGGDSTAQGFDADRTALDFGDAPLAAGGQSAGDHTVVPDSQAQPAIEAWLLVTSGPASGVSYQIREGENTIGRDMQNDFSISDSRISRKHAMLKASDGKYVLADVGSSGGTTIGGRRLDGGGVSAGGIITVGATNLLLVDVQSGGDQPAAPDHTVVDAADDEQAGGMLVAQTGPDSGRAFELPSNTATIGRDPTCDISLTDMTVSRTHALVRADRGGGFTVFDLASASGTFIDGARVDGFELANEDVIGMGGSQIRLQIG